MSEEKEKPYVPHEKRRTLEKIIKRLNPTRQEKIDAASASVARGITHIPHSPSPLAKLGQEVVDALSTWWARQHLKKEELTSWDDNPDEEE